MKNLYRQSLLLLSLFLSLSALAQNNIVSAGKIDILNGTTNVNFADATCQCDTIIVEYEIKPNANFASTTSFEYQLATNPALNWGTATQLSLVMLEKNDPPVALTLPSDTFSSGKKWAHLAIPCNTPIGIYGLRIINRNANGTITPIDGFSDTTYRQINRIPTVGVVDSLAIIRAGSRIDTVDNPYTSAVDIGICFGDSVYLRVNTDATRIQWFNGSLPVNGETKDSILVGYGQGAYYAELTNNGNCPIYSDTVLITPVATPTTITFDPNNPANANAYQVDFPNNNNSPLDSIELCESDIALLSGPIASPATGLTYTYQWLTDSFNPVTGNFDWYALTTPTATQRILQINQNSSIPGWNRYRIVVNDGFCQDTTPILNQYWVNIDTTPNATVAGVPFPGFTGPTVFNEICMRDSVKLSTIPFITNGDWKFRWQWYDPTSMSWRSVSGQPVGSLEFDTLADITIDTSLSDPGQPYFQNPKASVRFFRVRIATETTFRGIETCVFFSDSVAVRWYPEYDLTLAPNQPQVNVVGQDSINFCENDSAIIQAPSTPLDYLAVYPGRTYTYQWLTDSLDPNNGTRVKYALTGETNRSYIARTSGNYFVVLDDGICLDTSHVYRVFVDSLPSTSILEVPYAGQGLTGLNLCLYDSALVSALDSVGGIRPWLYQWQQYNPNTGGWFNLTNDTNITFQVDTSYKRVGEDTAWFRLTTTYFNQFGLQTCASTTDSLFAVFYNSPTLNFFPGDSVGLCPGDSILFVAQGNFNQVTWTAGNVGGATRYINTPGTYPVRAVGENGCITRDTVTVFPLIVNAAAGPDQTAGSGEIVSLTAFGGTDYRWWANKPLQFSDFLSQTIQVSKVLENGVLADTITVYVEVTNQRGCVGIDSLQLIIKKDFPAQITNINRSFNIFTPNGDGLNDMWDVRELLDGSANCQLQVMNRWGSVVYEDDSFNGMWDGTDNGGNELVDGTYYYTIDCGGTILMQNAVTIIRNQQ